MKLLDWFEYSDANLRQRGRAQSHQTPHTRVLSFENQYSLPPVDVTVSARDAARQANSSDLRASLDKHWKSITQRCQT